nr:unnamed protein product [Callosobruchus chinensis]
MMCCIYIYVYVRNVSGRLDPTVGTLVLQRGKELVTRQMPNICHCRHSVLIYGDKLDLARTYESELTKGDLQLHHQHVNNEVTKRRIIQADFGLIAYIEGELFVKAITSTYAQRHLLRLLRQKYEIRHSLCLPNPGSTNIPKDDLF